MFKMKPNESIVEMFTRFTDVVNGLEGLGKRVSEQDKVSKILRCLPPKWNSKTEAIEEAKNLKVSHPDSRSDPIGGSEPVSGTRDSGLGLFT